MLFGQREIGERWWGVGDVFKQVWLIVTMPYLYVNFTVVDAMKACFLIIYFGMLVSGSCAAELPQYVYKPVVRNVQSGNWEDLFIQLDSIEKAFPDSIMIPMTSIYVGEVLESRGNGSVLKTHAYRMLRLFEHRSSYRIPMIKDPIWRIHIEQQVYALRRYASAYLSDIFYDEKAYDSCLRYIDYSEVTYLYNHRTHERSLMDAHLHRVYRKSVCLEKTGELEKARLELLPYLFLDDAIVDSGRFTHPNVVDRYVILRTASNADNLPEEIVKSMRLIATISEDSLLLPSGWREYYSWQNMYAVKVEKAYVPVVFSYFYAMDHPRPQSEPLKVENPVVRQLNPEVREAEPILNPDDLIYMQGYLEQTLLFKALNR